jgi:hypothetical protein
MAFRGHSLALFCDLYEVTMVQAYWAGQMAGTAAFEAFAWLYPGTTLLADTYDTRRGSIFASSALDEHRIAALVEAGCPMPSELSSLEDTGRPYPVDISQRVAAELDNLHRIHY